MKDLTVGGESSNIVAFALPMLLGNIFQQFYNMVDSFVVGRFIGPAALAAVGTSFPVIFLMLSLIMGVAMGASILISQYFGAGNREKVRITVDTAYTFLFCAGIAVSILGVAAAYPILSLLHVPEEIREPAAAYLRITFAGMLPIFGFNAISAVLRGLGDSKTPLFLLIGSTLVNIVLDLVFVLAFGGGVASVAWATVIAQGTAFVGGLVYLDSRNDLVRVRIRGLVFDRDIFRAQIRLGIPTGIQQTLVSIGIMAITRIVNGFGTTVMAGFAAASRLDSLAMMPAMNLSQAITTFTGQNIGAGLPDRVKRGHRAALAIGIGISVFITVVMILFGSVLMSIFSADPEVVAVGSKYLLIVGLFYWLFVIMFINNGVLRGAGDAIVPMISTLLALYLVRIPCAILLSGPAGLGPDGIWWAIPSGWVMGAIFSSVYYASGRWKTASLRTRRQGPPPGAGPAAGRAR